MPRNYCTFARSCEAADSMATPQVATRSAGSSNGSNPVHLLIPAQDESRSDTDSDVEINRSPREPSQNVEYPKEYLKTFLSLIVLFLCTFFKGLVVAYIHQFVNDKQKPLSDVIFEHIPYQQWAWWLADVMVTVCSTVCCVVVIFHKHNSIVGRRLALLAAILYFFRAAFLSCTFLPPPFPDVEVRCLPRWNISSDPWRYVEASLELVFTAGFSAGRKEHAILCGDTIYSGHTMIYMLTLLFTWEYCPRPWRPLVPLCLLSLVVCGVTSVMISRQHYSIDVVVAVFVTVSVFFGFHVWCHRRRGDQILAKANFLGALKWAVYCDGWAQARRSTIGRRTFRIRPLYLIFFYFEKNVPHGTMPNELAWPLPWPKFMVELFERWNSCTWGLARMCPCLKPPKDNENIGKF